MTWQAYDLDNQPVGGPFYGALAVAAPPQPDLTQAGDAQSLATEVETHILHVHRSVTSIVPPCKVQNDAGERFAVLGKQDVSARLNPRMRLWRVRREQW